ncbi:MAG: hypothetical protein ACI92C_002861 [Neolewinella sp.]|jgi:hypothetical protein
MFRDVCVFSFKESMDVTTAWSRRSFGEIGRLRRAG